MAPYPRTSPRGTNSLNPADQGDLTPLDEFWDVMRAYGIPMITAARGNRFGYTVYANRAGLTVVRVLLKNYPPMEYANKDPQAAARHWLDVEGQRFELRAKTWQSTA